MKVFAALRNDASEGWVWLQDARLAPRSIIKIENQENGRAVYCEALQIDDNFLREYNQPPRVSIQDPANSIIMSQWYRARLGGLTTMADHALEVSAANHAYGRLQACLDHPQLVVRVAVWLGIISVGLGVIGVAPWVKSLWQALKMGASGNGILKKSVLSFSYVLVVIGSVGMVLFANRFSFSTRIKDLELTQERLLGLNGYQVWKYSWLSIILGTLGQLIGTWMS